MVHSWVGPQQRHEIDPLDDGMVLARPVASDQFDSLGVRFVEGGVVGDKNALGQVHLHLRLLPEGFGIRFEAVQQPCEGVMGRWPRLLGLDLGGLGGTARLGCGDEEVDVVFGLHTRWIHKPKTTDPPSIAQAENPSTA
jgi:hypothetical protein